MSTRSGKRIHSSFLEEGTMKFEEEVVLKSERKTRSKRLKENDSRLDMTLPKTKKLNNYVHYPTDDESNSNTIIAETDKVKNTRQLRRNTLKDQNFPAPATEGLDSKLDVKKAGRLTRRTKKIADICEDIPDNAEGVEIKEVVLEKKLKKSKKNKKKSKDDCDPATEMVNGDVAAVKKSKRKKNKQSNSISEEVQSKDKKNKSLNKSNMSSDSFHTAAGSPLKESPLKNNINEEITPAIENNKTFEKDESPTDMINSNINSDKKKQRKSSTKTSTFDKIENISTQSSIIGLNSTFDKNALAKPVEQLNTTYEKEPEIHVSKTKPDSLNNTLVNTSKNKTVALNSTFDKNNKTVYLNSTYDKNSAESTEKLNTTFEKEPTIRKTTSDIHPEILINSSEKAKDSEMFSLNSTYEKDTKNNLDITFDKSESKSISARSSLISSDATINRTFDRSDNPRISIISDDSKTENIVNTTPVLIESSIDESLISNTVNETLTENCNETPRDSIQDSKLPEKTPPTIVREGTFTKDSPDVLASPKSKSSMVKTPTRSMSLPSPGFTPFHMSRSSQMEKSTLNVTRSIEKSSNMSLSAETAPRLTKVMFCSPVNNPAITMQQTRKVIKSSLKGSNKSFVFNESVSEGGRAAGRKRSFTQNDADDARAHSKRKRLTGDELQNSVSRLARPRTCSAAAKPSEATPTKKPVTPSALKSSSKPARTKLPNFAALHQRRFEQMESLGECQERKRKRARQLLTPTGGVAVLERSSPRGITLEPVKETLKTPKQDILTPKESVKKPMNASKTLPTLDSLKPGYTRFGFKMNIGVNPFCAPRVNETKPKENKPKGAAKEPIKPSSAGSTLNRREVAKQTVMREKSFTSLAGKRDMKRNENRTIIKGVRTNRRFELQMKMREIN